MENSFIFSTYLQKHFLQDLSLTRVALCYNKRKKEQHCQLKRLCQSEGDMTLMWSVKISVNKIVGHYIFLQFLLKLETKRYYFKLASNLFLCNVFKILSYFLSVIALQLSCFTNNLRFSKFRNKVVHQQSKRKNFIPELHSIHKALVLVVCGLYSGLLILSLLLFVVLSGKKIHELITLNACTYSCQCI